MAKEKVDSLQSKRSKGILIQTLVVGLGFFFFLTSKLWFQDTGDLVDATSYYQDNSYDTYNVQVARWIYSPEQGIMHVFLELENSNILGGELSYEAVERSQGNLNISICASDSDFVILQLSGVKDNWKEISLRIFEEDITADPLKIYTNKGEVEVVDSIDTDQTGTDYLCARYELQFQHNLDLITDYEDQITAIKKENEDYSKRISELQEQEAYQTEEEVTETESTISTAQGNIDSNNNTIFDLESKIKTLEEKNVKIQELIDTME